MITASHLPSHRNGFKFFTKAGGLNNQNIAEVTRAEGISAFVFFWDTKLGDSLVGGQRSLRNADRIGL